MATNVPYNNGDPLVTLRRIKCPECGEESGSNDWTTGTDDSDGLDKRSGGMDDKDEEEEENFDMDEDADDLSEGGDEGGGEEGSQRCFKYFVMVLIRLGRADNDSDDVFK